MELLIGALGFALFIAIIIFAEIKFGKLNKTQIIRGASTTAAMLICIFLFTAGHSFIQKYTIKFFPRKENLRIAVEMIAIALMGFTSQRLIERFIRREKS